MPEFFSFYRSVAESVRNPFTSPLKQMCMVPQKTDRVLVIVGIILIVAFIGWIVAASAIPSSPDSSTKKVTKYTSTGKSVGGAACNNPGSQISRGCQSGAIQGQQAASSQKKTKFTSTGASAGESPCCKNNGTGTGGFQSGKAGGCQGQQGGAEMPCCKNRPQS